MYSINKTKYLFTFFLKYFGLEEKTLPEDKDSDPKTKHPGVTGKQTE